MVQPVDGRSRKAVLIPPTPGELARLAEKSRALHLEPDEMPAPHLTPRNLKRRLSRQEVAEIVSRYNAGHNTPALARDYGIAKSALLQLLRKEGVPLRKQAITSADAKQAARLYKRGLSITEIVERIGYSYSTVRKSLHESGVVMRPKGIKRSALNKD